MGCQTLVILIAVFRMTLVSCSGPKLGYRERRSRETNYDNCTNLDLSSVCLENVTWDLQTMILSANCSGVNSTPKSDCIEKHYCHNAACRVKFDNLNYTHGCQNVSASWDKWILLKLLCTSDIIGQPCLGILSPVYLDTAGSGKKILQQLDTSLRRCCIGSLMKPYNSSGNVTELLPNSWKEAGLQVPKDCQLKSHSMSTTSPSIKTYVTTSERPTQLKQTTLKIKQISTSSQPSKTETQPKKQSTAGSNEKMSARLKASLVIASLIFIAVAAIVGRFIYQRVQRKKRAKYEDYGYSQLKVILDDDLYEDEEDDDDQLLSAT